MELLNESKEGKLLHLEHPEDEMISHPHGGFLKAVGHLDTVHSTLSGNTKTPANISTKYDGSPSVVFGHHPETGKFFVATKGAFNKHPKLNYTHQDIERNHLSSGLKQKLHTALKHLPKAVGSDKGVYQGDLMYTHHDLEKDDKHFHFKPNLIRYSAHKDSEEGKKIAKSKLGIVVHTKYEGKDLSTAKAAPGRLESKHSDVHTINPGVESNKVHYSPEGREKYEQHIQKAAHHFSKVGSGTKDVIKNHGESLKNYINDSIKNRQTMHAKGFHDFVAKKLMAHTQSLKPQNQDKHIAKSNEILQHIHLHHEGLEHIFKAHEHLQHAKQQLIHALDSHHMYQHTIEGRTTKPEGYVSEHQGHMIKLVNRHVFSQANLAKERTK
jgi:hypothetical protein